MTMVWSDLVKYHAVVSRLDTMGMTLGGPKYSSNGDKISVYPKKDSMPFYSPNIQLFSGNLDQISDWITGVEFSREYDRVCGLKTDNRREIAENKCRNRKLLDMMKPK